MAGYVRRLSNEDYRWAAAIMERRRRSYARYSPIFWRPATGVTELHRRHLAETGATTGNVAVRTDAGFIIAELRGREGVVDDFAVEPDEAWASDGTALLRSAWRLLSAQGARTIRAVTAAADKPKVTMLEACSLTLAEHWWVRPLEPLRAGPSTRGRLAGHGFSGIIGPAPPVYDPGGPVLLVDHFDDGADLLDIERQAAASGAVLAVVPVPAGSTYEDGLRRADWTIASAWYLGQPA